jgi:hypothetical protein
MSRTLRERRAPLAPDEAVRPLTERGLAQASARGTPLEEIPAGAPIVIDSDSDISDNPVAEVTNLPGSSSRECRTFLP